jgi:uncharacterized membrane protein YraQ (UPF0718 family)
MDTDALVMGGLTILMIAWAFTKGNDVPLRGIQAGFGLLREVWLPLLFGFCLAGLIEVLIPRELLVKWMGEESGARGILIGWLVGLLMPGGPYVVFPLTASLLREGIGIGPLLTFITAKLLLSPIRLFTWEIPFLGWAFVAARTVPSLFLPPIVGIIGQRLYALFPKL